MRTMQATKTSVLLSKETRHTNERKEENMSWKHQYTLLQGVQRRLKLPFAAITVHILEERRIRTCETKKKRKRTAMKCFCKPISAWSSHRAFKMTRTQRAQIIGCSCNRPGDDNFNSRHFEYNWEFYPHIAVQVAVKEQTCRDTRVKPPQ